MIAGPSVARAVCPSDLQLEEHLLGTADMRRHLDGCCGCRARVARMVREGDDFHRFVYPVTVKAVRAAAERIDHRPSLGERLLLLVDSALSIVTGAARDALKQ